MNTILVTVDALRADHLGQYGYERDTMPVLDRLTDEGVTFDNAFANGPYTRISVPSFHTSRLLGYQEIHDRPTIASVLGEAGVRTAGIGTRAGLDKVDVEGDLIFDTYVDFGRDEYYERANRSRPLRDKVAQRLAESRLLDDDRLYGAAKALYDRLPLAVGNPVRSLAYTSAAEVTDAAVDWLASSADDDFFLWLHYMEGHRPHGVHDDVHEYVDGPVDEDAVRTLLRKAGAKPERVTRGENRLIRDLYDSDLRYCSRHLGRLFDDLERRDLWEETNVVFTSDHGEGFGEHGHYYHRYPPYDELIHVPLVVRSMETDGTRVAEQRELLDLAPTICDFHDVDTGGLSFQGEHLFAGEDRRVIAVGSQRHPGPVVAGRWDGWKYLSVEGEPLLFDLAADPGETTDASSEHPDVVSRFEREIPDSVFDLEPEELAEPDDALQRERLEALGYLEIGDE